MEFGVDKIPIPKQHSFLVRKVDHLESLPPRIHSHNNFELNFILSGSGRRIVGNHISSFGPGDLVLLGPNLPHCWEFLEWGEQAQASCIVIHFYEGILGSHFFSIPELNQVEQLLRQAHSGIWFKCSSTAKLRPLLEHMLQLDPLERLIELLKVFHCLLRIQNRESLSIPMGTPSVFSKDIDRINLVYEYVFQHIQEGIELEKAANLLNMAPASFCRYFKRKTRQTFMQYVKSVRIGIAAKLLIETDKQITRICYESGYNNLANFNHQFRAVMQTTPSAYRKKFR